MLKPHNKTIHEMLKTILMNISIILHVINTPWTSTFINLFYVCSEWFKRQPPLKDYVKTIKIFHYYNR